MDENIFLDDIISFDIDKCRWDIIHCTDRPSGRADHSAFLYNGCMYIFCGRQFNTILNDLHEFNLSTLKWRQIQTKGDVPAPRFSHSVNIFNDELFLFGGVNFEELNDMYVLDLKNFSWNALHFFGYVPCQRYDHATCNFHDTFYLFGGVNHSYLNDFWRFETQVRRWKIIHSLNPPSKRAGHFLKYLNGKLYLFGGTNSQGELNDLWCYSITQNRWQIIETSNSPCKRTNFASFVHQGGIILFGGGNQDNSMNDIHKFWCPTGLEYISELQEEKLFADFTLTFKNNSFLVHKFIIEQMYNHIEYLKDMVHGTEILKKLIEFCYNSSIILKPSDAYYYVDLTHFASLRKIEDLELICYSSFENVISIENFPSIFRKAREYKSKVLLLCQDYYFKVPKESLTLEKDEVLFLNKIRFIYPPRTANFRSDRLEKHIAHIYDNSIMTDITLISKDEVAFKAHKAILAKSCPFFANMLKNGFKESNENEITLQMVNSKHLKLILNFIYKRKIECDDIPTLFALLSIGDMLMMENLMEHITILLLAKITRENALQIMESFQSMKIPVALKEKCLSILSKDYLLDTILQTRRAIKSQGELQEGNKSGDLKRKAKCDDHFRKKQKPNII